MTYIWELMAHAKSQGIHPATLTFRKALRFSPGLELSFEDLNQNTIPSTVEVNPYYRFVTVFKDYFAADYNEDIEIRHELFNLMMHYLAELDTHMGMTKREYELAFVVEDIERGLYGGGISDGFQLFTPLEKKIVAEQLLRLHELSERVYLFQETVKKLYAKAVVYGHLTDQDGLMVHVCVEESAAHRTKIQTLACLFLPIHDEVAIYWIHLFGIMGVDGAMKQEEIVMY